MKHNFKYALLEPTPAGTTSGGVTLAPTTEQPSGSSKGPEISEQGEEEATSMSEDQTTPSSPEGFGNLNRKINWNFSAATKKEEGTDSSTPEPSEASTSPQETTTSAIEGSGEGEGQETTTSESPSEGFQPLESKI